jgi:deazaflavin-dependent oxidoreductase (nitroreductase family)
MNPIQRLFIATHTRLFRATGGRIGSSILGGKVLLLTTTGNKSGQPRTVPVMYFERDGRRFVVASNNGAPTHPAWFKNLSRTPSVTVEVPGDRYAATAKVLGGDERARVYAEVAREQPRFAGYQQKAGSREIPIVELTRAPG